MSLLTLFIIGGAVFIIGVVIMVIAQHKEMSQYDDVYDDDDDFDEDEDEDEDDDDYDYTERRNFNPWRNSSTSQRNQSGYDPYDNHWESSFDWKDNDNDGYDDRDDGFWNEREF